MSDTVLIIVHPYAPNIIDYTDRCVRLAEEVRINVERRLCNGEDYMRFLTYNPIKRILFERGLRQIDNTTVKKYEGYAITERRYRSLYNKIYG